jgi:hypothetical protein
MQVIGVGVDRCHNPHILAFKLLGFVLVVQLVRGVCRIFLEDKFAARFLNPALEGTG